MTHPLVRELRRTWYYWVGSGLFALGVTAAMIASRTPPEPGKPNILVISTCSLRHSYLATYSQGIDYSPVITELGRRSFVFENALTELTWTNLVNFIAKDGVQLAEKYGYRMIGNRSRGSNYSRRRATSSIPFFFRIPDSGDPKGLDGIERMPIQKYLEELREAFQASRQPFLSQVHLKAMHLPFLSDSQQLRRLAGRKYPMIRRYLDAPENFPEKTALFATLLPSNHMERHLRAHPKRNRPAIDAVLRKMRSKKYIGLAQNSEFLQDWVTSPGFSEDVGLLRQIYGERLRWYDQVITPLITLYGDPTLQKNTIIIFTGDHGEALMEHGLLTHGETPWEEVMRIPLMVYFPGHQTQVRLPDQIRSISTKDLIAGLMSGQLREDNFAEWVKNNIHDDYAYGRDCGNLQQAVRYRNKWKLFNSLDQEVWRLYDLEHDPGELRDVSKEYPHIVAQLREKLEGYESVKTVGHPTCSGLSNGGDAFGD